MESGLSSLGSSLLVPCVQELVKEPLTAVPHRYVRPEQDSLVLSNATDSMPHVPIIDLHRLLSADFTHSELEKLHRACQEWGFFQLINHGVSSSLVEKVKAETQEFFNLPLEEKKKFWQKPGEVEGFGQAFVVSEEQKLDWGDIFFMSTLPTHFRKPHLFPKLPLPFRDTLEVYVVEMRNLALTMLSFMEKALKIEVNEMRELFEQGLQGMRMNYYPPCPKPEQVIGLTPHSDSVGLTILLQVNEVEGLQIRKDGMWIPITPLPNAFIVNIGDILEIFSNGIYKSIEHRAVVNSVKERLSIATFYNPHMDAEIGPVPSLITPEFPALFRRVGVADYLKKLFSRELGGKSYLEVLRIDGKEEGQNI
ncbi:hypothetical protein AAG906_039034 [Vitis piasezkii]